MNFYPRPPCGGRPAAAVSHLPHYKFLSTPSVWRATQPARRRIQQRLISIHALRAEGDAGLGSPVPARWEFLSTLSSRRATLGWQVVFNGHLISIHALLAESDQISLAYRSNASAISIHALLAESDPQAVNERPIPDISIHALLAESDECLRMGQVEGKYFYPRSPRGERPARFTSG